MCQPNKVMPNVVPALSAVLAAVCLVWLGVTGSFVMAQDEAIGDQQTDPLEAYMLDKGLDDLVSVYLLDELKSAPASQRSEIAERLGAHYAALLSQAKTPQRQREIQDKSRALLALVPDSDSYELRITLHKASFLLAETTARNFVLDMTTNEEVTDALRVFRDVSKSFADIGRKIDRRIGVLERLESNSTDADLQVLRAQLANARRLRSLSMYYAGWSHYYISLLADDPREATAARKALGWLLNAPGNREPELASVPTTLLRYEHVARAALAVALSYSTSHQDVVAIQWLDTIENADETPVIVRDEIPSRRLEVLARAKRWADLQRLIDTLRLGVDPEHPKPLSIGQARLVAVMTLKAIDQGGGRDATGADRTRLLEAMAQVAMGDLVAQGEIGHVIDLVKRFGTAPIGDTGFVVLYVRGLQSYERARDIHAAQGGGDEPSTNEQVINRYMQAVEAIDLALLADDANRFPDELLQAGMMKGLSLYYASQLEQASNAFVDVFNKAHDTKVKQEALWYAIVSLDRAVEQGQPSLTPTRDRLATIFLQEFPATDRAAKLLLRRIDDGLLSNEEAIAVLLDVPVDSPMYEAARRHASRLLYRQFRESHGQERDYAAANFLDVAQELIAIDMQTATTQQGEEADRARQFVVLRVRQALDAALSVTVPDVTRAEKLLDLLEQNAQSMKIDLSSISGELAYRRLQIALDKGDEQAVRLAADRLARTDGVYARSGDRLLYRHAFDQWKVSPEDSELALNVVNIGLRVLKQFDPVEKHKNDKTILALINTIAKAAIVVWEQDNDDAMRDIAIKMDSMLVTFGKQTAQSLRRLAKTTEAAGDIEKAHAAWKTLLVGLREGSNGWFEARVETIRLLAMIDPAQARAVLDQHKVLYPHWGPEPWGQQLRDLDRQLTGYTPVPTDTPANDDDSSEPVSSSPSGNNHASGGDR